MWTTWELRYLDEHAEEGAEAIAEALGKTVKAVQWQASQRGVSLAIRYTCPRCGKTTRQPLNARTGFCKLCNLEVHMAQLKEEARREQEEVRKEQALMRERNRYYNQKYRAKKKRK